MIKRGRQHHRNRDANGEVRRKGHPMPKSTLPADDRLAYSVEDLVRILPLRRAACYGLAREIGAKVGRKHVVPRAALERWLSRPRSAS
jgi:hypothetical protein